MAPSLVVTLFLACSEAAKNGKSIVRESSADKEFHFQRWFQQRLEESKVRFSAPQRNTYPDFRLSDVAERYEVKGLATPGRYKSYDANSQVPMGRHQGRAIYYVFGRYPKGTAKEFPLTDLVLCHGDFLNTDYEYSHQNQSVRGFGSYGDIMIRDRKMYVAPTPFALVPRTEGRFTLILPADHKVEDKRLRKVGKDLVRRESAEIVVGYDFDLREGHGISAEIRENPSAGATHTFYAYREASEASDTQLELVEPKLDDKDLEVEEEVGG